MNITKLFTVSACALTMLLGTAFAADKTCCEKAKADGKECTHKCCVAAVKDGKVCEKCNPKAEEKK